MLPRCHIFRSLSSSNTTVEAKKGAEHGASLPDHVISPVAFPAVQVRLFDNISVNLCSQGAAVIKNPKTEQPPSLDTTKNQNQQYQKNQNQKYQKKTKTEKTKKTKKPIISELFHWCIFLIPFWKSSEIMFFFFGFFGFLGFGSFGIFGFVFFSIFGFGVFGIVGFGFFGCVTGKGLLCFRVLITAAPLSVRVDSDVVEEACLNCPKRSGRV